MGRPKVKTIETAIEEGKLKDLEPRLELSEAGEEEVKKEVKQARKKVGKAKVRSQRYQKLLEGLDKINKYPVEEAISLLKKTSATKFDSTLEAHINLGTDSTKSDQQIRRAINLPHGLGKKISVLVFADEKDEPEIKKAGAQLGTEKSLDEIAKGKINFDKVVAIPSWMPKLAKVAKVLGPKGLMPNPKTGTVSDDPLTVVEKLSAGMSEIKTEKSPIVHTVFGKASFDEKKLKENLESLIKEIHSSRPANFKKELIKSVYLTSSMGPSLKLDLTSTK
ncbi:MAG: 50S ribosomal protein L1 [bacterium]|nr:50S ribosomal protein L1 [bacterium]